MEYNGGQWVNSADNSFGAARNGGIAPQDGRLGITEGAGCGDSRPGEGADAGNRDEQANEGAARTYRAAGVNVEAANDMKSKFGEFVSAGMTDICRPINRVGAFASLIDVDLSAFKQPVFVMKSEEPGSKQLLSFDNDRIEWIAGDLINHLINDVIVMGATPCAVLDTVICGNIDEEIMLRLVRAMAKSCEENRCVLVGGETSEQPGVLPAGRYVLQASAMGVVDRGGIVDGSAIRDGDVIVSLASNGLHTNGYSLVRKIMADAPRILEEPVGGERFIDALLKPHTPYSGPVRRLLQLARASIHGMAHITGGGAHDNLIRILPDGMAARIDLTKLDVPPIFRLIRQYGGVADAEMLAAFNMGMGMLVVADPSVAELLPGFAAETRCGAAVVGAAASGRQKRAVSWKCQMVRNAA
jgi:phosphoribosylformylglycinamidine cyclo-ligase